MNERSSALDKTSDEPLYIQLYTILQEEIESLYHMGDQIDSEREICLKYGVSRTRVCQIRREAAGKVRVALAGGKRKRKIVVKRP